MFYGGLVLTYLLFSDLIKLTFRPWHLLIHESFTTREVSFENRAEKPDDILTLLANLEECGTGICHEVGLAALGTAINDSAAPTYINLINDFCLNHKTIRYFCGNSFGVFVVSHSAFLWLTYFGSKENVHFFKAFTSKNTTFTAVECVFAYRCLFPYLTKVKLGCTRKRKQVFFSLVSTSFAAHLQHAHANSLFIDSVHFEEVK